VHPRDDDPALGPGESGKPEAWVVLERAPGAGLWLGLADGVTREDFVRALDAGADRSAGSADDGVRELLAFVPVEVGDVFAIEAGTVHAIGPGVTLLEPQLVRRGKRGITYRLWDWGRRFDARGRRDPRGAPRPLHRERSLAVTTWDGPRGAAFHASCRRSPVTLARAGDAHHERVFDFHEMRLERVRGDGPLTLPARGAFSAITVVAGELSLHLASGGRTLRHGQTAAVPAGAGALTLDLAGADAFIIAPRPVD
jgi:mannose-6-phosphate isomerase